MNTAFRASGSRPTTVLRPSRSRPTGASGPNASRHAGSSARRIVAVVLPPVLFGIAFIAVWQIFVRAADIKPYVLAAPSDIWSAFTEHHSRIIEATLQTGRNALVGLIIGAIVGVLLAALAARFSWFNGMATPLVSALAAVPIVCLAPLFNHMYSLLSNTPRRDVVAIAAFVPIFINTVRGLSQLSPVHRELMQSYAASGTAVLVRIRIPNALPHFFIGLRVAASVSVITAVVAEYFGGVKKGLGSRITDNIGSTDYPQAWASIFGAVVLGLIFFLVTLIVERLVLGRRAAALT